MKNKFITILPVLAIGMMLTGCGHEHTWVEATCTEPKTCSECGEAEGESLGHTWTDATCTVEKTCSVCGETEGSALGHTWIDATYELPKTCSACGETEGEPLEKTVEYLLKNDYPDVAEKYDESCAEALESYSEIYLDITFEATDNEIGYKYVLLEGRQIDTSYFDDPSIAEKTSAIADEEITNLEAQIGKRAESFSYTYLSSDGEEIYKYTYNDN